MNVWEAIEALEGHSRQPYFLNHWRAFIRECSLLILPSLPREAREWLTAADDYEQGRIGAGALEQVRSRAWRFHDARRESAPPAELSGLRAVMYRLWPTESRNDWDESAFHFLDFCVEAGLDEEQMFPRLLAQYPAILGGGTDTSAHTIS